MKHFKLFFLAVAVFVAVSCNYERGEADYDIVPLPQSITLLDVYKRQTMVLPKTISSSTPIP